MSDNLSPNIIDILLGKIGGNVGHNVLSAYIELIDNAFDAINNSIFKKLLELDKAKISIAFNNEYLIIWDNGEGESELSKFFNESSKKQNQMGSKNQGFKDSIMCLTDGFLILDIFSKTEKSFSHLNINLDQYTTAYNNKFRETNDRYNIDCNAIRKKINNHPTINTYEKNNLDKRTQNSINSDLEFLKNKIQIKNIENVFNKFNDNNTGTLIIIENTKKNMKELDISILENHLKTTYNNPINIDLYINKETRNIKIDENQAINLLLNNDINGNKILTFDTKNFTSYVSLVSTETVEEQLRLYKGYEYKTNDFKYGVLFNNGRLINMKAFDIFDKKEVRNISNIRFATLIKNNEIAKELTLTNKGKINRQRLKQNNAINWHIDKFRMQLKKYNLDWQPNDFKQLHPNLYQTCIEEKNDNLKLYTIKVDEETAAKKKAEETAAKKKAEEAAIKKKAEEAATKKKVEEVTTKKKVEEAATKQITPTELEESEEEDENDDMPHLEDVTNDESDKYNENDENDKSDDDIHPPSKNYEKTDINPTVKNTLKRLIYIKNNKEKYYKKTNNTLIIKEILKLQDRTKTSFAGEKYIYEINNIHIFEHYIDVLIKLYTEKSEKNPLEKNGANIYHIKSQ